MNPTIGLPVAGQPSSYLYFRRGAFGMNTDNSKVDPELDRTLVIQSIETHL